MLYPGFPWQSSRFLGTGKRTVRQVRKLGINQADMSPARGLVFSKYVGIEGSTLPNEQAALGRAAPRKISRLSMGKIISP